ncbi:uncharacterized protein LOC134184436 isoform X2 [Corticium candelabrum]|uniref:uncharacterized protein LOC134184436 isoform X2 n=1 Tax=Corticium candelabrum TaxID=121492 RepID=UPI002E2ECE6A|nr:uncharacterized protein LOC134184436 isoform X2 [Corticium candelabrum]
MAIAEPSKGLWAVSLHKFLKELEGCQDDLICVRQEAERIFYEADKLFRPWPSEHVKCDSKSTVASMKERERERECKKTLPCATPADKHVSVSRQEPGTNNGTEIEQANIQESINMEALDKVLAMAVNARKIQAQHEAVEKQGKRLKLNTTVVSLSRSSIDGKIKSRPTRTVVRKTSRYTDSASKHKSLTTSSLVKTRTSGVASEQSRGKTSERGLKPAACTKDEKSEAQQKTMISTPQTEKTAVNAAGDRKDNCHVKTTAPTLKSEQQSCVTQPTPFNLSSDGSDLKIPGSYRRAVLHAERLLENLQVSREKDHSSAAHFIQRLKTTFDFVEHDDQSRECQYSADFPTQISGQCDDLVVTSLNYSDFKELDHYLSLQCETMLLRLDIALCQIALRDILPVLTESLSSHRRSRVVLDLRCVLQLLTPRLRMLPRACVTESRMLIASDNH